MPTFTAGALALLKQLEGLRLDPYRDGAGVWSVAWGHTGPDVHPGDTWTQARAEAALANDTARFVTGVGSLVRTPPDLPLSDQQFSALVIFAYNVGLTALAGPTALKRVNAGQFNLVPIALEAWNKIHLPTGEYVVSQ